MTKEERIAQLAELKAKAEEHCKLYNEAFQEARFTDASAEEAIITETVNEYTRIVRDGVFQHCKESENPMLEAVKLLSFETIAAKDNKTEESKIPVRSIEPREKTIDLLKLHKYCEGIGAQKDWPYRIQKFNMLLTLRTCEKLGVKKSEISKINDSYLMSDIARQINLGKTPLSNTALLKTLQNITTAMIGDGYKVTSHDVEYLLGIYTKKGRKALSVTCANHSYLTRYLMEICNKIVTANCYEVGAKMKKEN